MTAAGVKLLHPFFQNSLMFKLEATLAKGYALQGNKVLHAEYETLAAQRKQAIQTLFFNEQKQTFVDLELLGGAACPVVSLAAVFPLYFSIASDAH